jgi:hypothetical protein
VLIVEDVLVVLVELLGKISTTNSVRWSSFEKLEEGGVR